MNQKRFFYRDTRRRILRSLVSLAVSAFGHLAYGQMGSRPYAVEANASVQDNPPRITVQWTSDSNATGYMVSRKSSTANEWTQLANLPASSLSYADNNVSKGTAYEYQVSKSTSSNYRGYGYVFAGIEAPLVESRGKIILMVDNTYAADLSFELSRLQKDLVGDGWTVLRHDVSRNSTPPQVKALIKADYQADPANTKAVFLFGHVAVPYSGNFHPDGHDNHLGAWPADVYYGDMDGNWTDSSVNNTTADKQWNWNVPGDGKFDQSNLPSDVELQVGRVDLSNMTTYANKTPPRSEKDLLRTYLNKDHNFRHGRLQVERRGLICDNFGDAWGEAFGASGWRSFASFFGASNVSETPGWTFFPTLQSKSYLWSFGGGGGSYYGCNGIGASDDFALNDIKTVFTMFIGSYFGDWDNESNFMRASLGSPTYTLTTCWSGRPQWFFHHMALGETIGYSTRLSQNNGGLYAPQSGYNRQVHIALLGDPSLRMHPVIPPSNLSASALLTVATLNWAPSIDIDIVGYHVYRASSPNGPFTRLTSGDPVTGTSFTDQLGLGNPTYMVRAIKLEQSGSGTYLNPSQGVFYTLGAGNSDSELPSAPTGLTAVQGGSAQVNLSWSDMSNNETAFTIERRQGTTGLFFPIYTLGANGTSYTDSGLASGTRYSYRVAANNSAGSSAYSNEASATVSSGSDGGGASRAVFVQQDSATKGDWKGTFGSEGFHIVGDSVQYPSYAVVTSSGKSDFVWKSSTPDARALQKANSVDRLAACWYSDPGFTMEVSLTDGKAHRMALYCLDWDTTARSQSVEVVDSTTGALLDRRALSGFNGGTYLIWDVKGSIRIRFTKVSGNNAVLMGTFFGPAAALPAESGKITDPSLNGSRFQLRVTGEIGKQFTIQASTDFSNWSKVGEVTLFEPAYNFEDSNAGNFKTRFYRAVPVN